MFTFIVYFWPNFISVIFMKRFIYHHLYLDQVPEPINYKKTQVAKAAQDFPAAGQDAKTRADEYQRGDLGQTFEEEHQLSQE